MTKPVDCDRLLTALTHSVKVDAENRIRHEEGNAISVRLATLTRREREILPFVVAGRLNKQIAGAIGTVEKTVKVHRMRMMSKLGVRCVADLVRLADRAGIAPSEGPRQG